MNVPIVIRPLEFLMSLFKICLKTSLSVDIFFIIYVSHYGTGKIDVGEMVGVLFWIMPSQ